MNLGTPEVEVLQLADLREDADDPRDISNEALDGLKASLVKFGYVDLLIVNKRNMEIVGGKKRFRVLREQGVESAACVLVDLDKMNQVALSVSLNNQQLQGQWTAALLPVLQQLKDSMPADYTALRLDELRKDLASLDLENNGAGNTLPDDVPDPPKTAITQPGDIWLLGPHRLMCGDSTDLASVQRLMNDQKAALFSSDPPYLVDYDGTNRPIGADGGGGGKDWSDVYHEKDIKDAHRFWTAYLEAGLQVVQQNAAVYVWHAFRKFEVLSECLSTAGLTTHQQIIWAKPVAVMSFCFYQMQHECCVMAWRKGFKPDFTHFKHKRGSVWTADLLKAGDPSDPEYYTDLWQLDWEGKKRVGKSIHPTQKPTEVFAIPMRLHTAPGDICYEPFSGSGSQIIAAERTGRVCYAMELEPVFCDVAIKRWEEFTGRKAELLC